MSCPGPAGGPSLQAPGGPGRQRGAAAPLPPGLEPPAGLLDVGPAPVVAPPPALPGAPELQKRVLDLEKSLQFVQQQHADTLLSLHAEVDRLRRDNRDLHYKLIMNQKLQRKGVTSSNSHFPKSNSGTVPPGCSRSKHALCCPKKQEVGESRGEEQDPGARMEKEPTGGEAMEASAATVTPMVSCQPQFKHILGITSSLKLPPHLRKLSTLQQCELVIRQLWNANHLQAQELQHLKSALEAGPRQAADGFLVNRSKRALGEKNSSHQCVFSAGSCARHEAGMQFPKVADKSAAKKCLILAPIPGAERAVLPALKQTLRNSFAERQKKMQAIQSRRLHRTVL